MGSYKVGIIGYGTSAKIYNLPYIVCNPDLIVYAFLQRDAAPDPTAAKSGSHCTIDFPTAKHYQSADQFFADMNIDVVVVCSPPHTHAIFAERALRTGKNVVVEKPMTTTVAEADHIIHVAKETGKLLTCFQNRRYDSDFLTLRHLIRQNVFGKIIDFETHHDLDNPLWSACNDVREEIPGQGMLFAAGSHSIDQAILLFGRPVSVTAFLRSSKGIESTIDDTFILVLQYGEPQKDLLVTIKTTIMSPMLHQLKNFIRGTDGSFIQVSNSESTSSLKVGVTISLHPQFGADPQEEQVRAGKDITSEDFGVDRSGTFGFLTTAEKVHDMQTYNEVRRKFHGRIPNIRGQHRDYYKDLVAAFRGEKVLPVDPQESRDGIKIIELARQSHKTGTTIGWI